MITNSSRRLLPVSDWPDADRRAWEDAMFGPYARTLHPPALTLIVEGYGRWIALLPSPGHLDDVQPADRVTPLSVQAYVDKLREAGNKPVTIVQRLGQLGAAMRIMAPDRSFTWLHPRKLLRGDRPIQSSADDKGPFRGWPEIDQKFWNAGMAVTDLLDGPRYASKLRPATIDTIIVGYRRWLTFLRDHDRLDPTTTPAARVTRENATAYLKSLRESNGNASVIARLTELRRALRIMHPDADFRWLTSPNGTSLETLLPATRKQITVIHSKVLYEWGRTMMQQALVEAHPEWRRIAYRNGLLIALFSARAPRVRSMASLRLGSTVIPQGKAYRLVFEHEDVKTNRCIEYDAPAGLSLAIDRYIKVERTELLGGKRSNAFWLDKYGEPLSADNISDMIQRQSAREFGEAFGPHRFRHDIGTTAPLTDPAHPGIAAAILGISGHMVEQHYNRASQADVAGKFHASLREQRAELEALARREFMRRGEG